MPVKTIVRPLGQPGAPLYLPQTARITRIVELVPDHKLFEVTFEDPTLRQSFTFHPGQFAMVSAMGTGEAPFTIASHPARLGSLEFCIRRAGRVTAALHRLQENDVVGLRGPYGNGFPVDEMKGFDLLLVAGGLGMAPLRSLLWHALTNRRDFGEVILLYGMRRPQEMLFYDELKNLVRRRDMRCLLSAERTNGDYEWRWAVREGMVTDLLDSVIIDVPRTYAIVCGPPVMYRFVVQKLVDKGFSKDKILMSLERKMQCGVGKCGHCMVGYKYTCIDGPIYTLWDAINLPEII